MRSSVQSTSNVQIYNVLLILRTNRPQGVEPWTSRVSTIVNTTHQKSFFRSLDKQQYWTGRPCMYWPSGTVIGNPGILKLRSLKSMKPLWRSDVMTQSESMVVSRRTSLSVNHLCRACDGVKTLPNHPLLASRLEYSSFVDSIWRTRSWSPCSAPAARESFFWEFTICATSSSWDCVNRSASNSGVVDRSWGR